MILDSEDSNGSHIISRTHNLMGMISVMVSKPFQYRDTNTSKATKIFCQMEFWRTVTFLLFVTKEYEISQLYI